jgi:hypothetical protein
MKNLLVHFSPDGGEDGGPGGDSDDSTATPPEGTPDTPGGDGKEETVPVAEFKKVQNEAKNLRKRLRDIETAQESKENEGKSEVEKLAAEKQEATQKLAATERRNHELLVEARAPKHGIADGEVAARLIDYDALEDPTDREEVDAALKALVKKHPFLTGTVRGGADGGAGSGSRQGNSIDMNAELRRATGRQA